MNGSNVHPFESKGSLTAIDRLDFDNLTAVDAARLEAYTADLERRVRLQIELAGGDSSVLDKELAEIVEEAHDAETEARALRLAAMCMTRKNHGA